MSSFFAEDNGESWFDGDHFGGDVEPVATEPPPNEGLMVAVAIVEADDANRLELAGLLGSGVSSFGQLGELVARLNGSPVVVLLGPSIVSSPEWSQLDRLFASHPEVGAILVAGELSTSLLQQALRSGIKDVLALPVDGDQVIEAVERVAIGLQSSAPRALPDAPNAPADFDGEPGRVVTVFSTKGGAGKSVIATNLAVLLAQRSDKPVCLVDADLQFGDIAVMLKLAPQHTIVDAVGSLDRLDSALLQNLLATHESSGLHILPAPLEPAFADQIGATEMVQIIEVLRRFCSHVVIDTPAYFNDVVLGLIEVSDDVLLVAGMDIPNIKNVKIGLQTLRLLNTPMEKLRLVLNRANSKVKLDVSEVERTLQVTADSLIPSDVVVPQAVNKGVPVVMSAPKSGVSRAMEDLADLFIASESRRKRR